MKLARTQWSRPLKIMLAKQKKKQGGVNRRVDAGKISDKSEGHQIKQSTHPKQPKSTSRVVDETRTVHTSAIPASRFPVPPTYPATDVILPPGLVSDSLRLS
jgi:hypothetical protein